VTPVCFLKNAMKFVVFSKPNCRAIYFGEASRLVGTWRIAPW